MDWYPRPELNRDQRFRKPLLYPFELRRQPSEQDHDSQSILRDKKVCWRRGRIQGGFKVVRQGARGFVTALG